MEKELLNQVAIVTGGNSGIGKAISCELALRGATVAILARNKNRNEETQKEIIAKGGQAECYSVDVSDTKAVNDAVNQIYSKYKQIDILVSNAGNATPLEYATKMSVENFQSVLKTHLLGAFNCVKACGENMRKRKYGRIVIISSVAGYHGFAGQMNYAVAKHGLVGMGYSLAKEFDGSGVTVNVIQPGIIPTPMCEGVIEVAKEELSPERIGKPEDIAYATAFFCSPRAGFMNGTPLVIDGGLVLETSVDRAVKQLLKNNSL
ncbi:3-oxoacyl-[acyl-carrier protein] reductase [Clostridium acetobutylicum]|uniref:3-oxoacyl-acyl carrier protein reductase n=1 Tax=Clostridium acetobutylicum (strain ATCC 824 / DSM 792 / JCM 1419 / IAM 19013 / LMG 5710 / NBRC 13948 / NRRL B-527 / VKM B-1787 / 2291 / W) TaxID=272562 RepID=Q97DL2_CLOAB|nr:MULTISPECIES: SDR family NAD(P)-dependent oxidoreductase [Clostridium]AAK81391.1 3-oxoacyl-acyl carrier protein reductase [Clostridium acetobutylicum ATCC 824]ADZ22503.1 3-oxoacyl-acyl carrier protein reductase [Clostridium acetobutylicum EA 2018]AEI34322.1 3-oxoacyl-acyl carrier protein reductase [Clostridium acetobutylicum DSM 1731]AWV80942.1 SDR family NAD(P)-dependent oxidoreductase [Clostridium acetobutylicum]MBC2393736.1 SDR family oxidoreductase [Clostridium acetobutylicum]